MAHFRMAGMGLVAISLIAVGCGEAATDGSRDVGNRSADSACNDCAEDGSAAKLIGTVQIDPPAVSLAGETLIIYVDDSISGAVLTTEFSAAATGAANIVDEVNAMTAGRVTAALDDGVLALTTDEAGVDVFLSVYDTGGAEILGLTGLGLARGAASQ